METNTDEEEEEGHSYSNCQRTNVKERLAKDLYLCVCFAALPLGNIPKTN